MVDVLEKVHKEWNQAASQQQPGEAKSPGLKVTNVKTFQTGFHSPTEDKDKTHEPGEKAGSVGDHTGDLSLTGGTGRQTWIAMQPCFITHTLGLDGGT